MKFQRRGHIVHVGSEAATHVPEGYTVYAATQHFCRAFLQGLRQQLSQYNVKITNIQPGDISTEKHLRIASDAPSNGNVLPPHDVSQAVIYALAQPQRTAVQDLALAPSLLPQTAKEPTLKKIFHYFHHLKIDPKFTKFVSRFKNFKFHFFS
jgi:NADP-dependent 3-hydroxy acid dehydrogenase YdfG